MFTPEGPTVRELATQALSSVERGYDLLAPKFDRTPFRTPAPVLDAVRDALGAMGPVDDGLDLCCGTGAGARVLTAVCRRSVTGVDLSDGMLTVARSAYGQATAAVSRNGDTPTPRWVRADARALPFGRAFDLVVSFGAFGHFLPREWPGLFAGVRRVLRPGGRFVFPLPAPAPPGSPLYWSLLAFDVAMRVRNLLWRPPFVMYYRPFRLGSVREELTRAGFTVRLVALPALGRRPDGTPRCRMVVAQA
ncbi:class I SAM-dependent methyltransferase [Streptomyces sp. ICBB 8177]|uniref:class I SAM-dependent methyltransferase n=1 Tax=Streptomyces sp. ICBB 8177 TaxID=563922 RepID=UPI000D683D50|nr:class I SAM-dependent methyltransferase [Streptomyces sp. ICBB 8177]PWI40917.1 SAM-dependent methyltransferase [Streptomyces sp. ICBB 8177]